MHSLLFKRYFLVGSRSRKPLLACPQLVSRPFTTVSQTELSELYGRLKAGDQRLKEMNPVDIMIHEQNGVDLPSFDFLFNRFINGDWGASKPKYAPQAVAKVVEFISVTNGLEITLNKEQLCKLVEMYAGLKDVVTPYQRFEALELISKIERKTSNLLQTAFLDELHDFYESEFAFVLSKVMDIQSLKALHQITGALRQSRFYEAELLKKIAFVYLMLSGHQTLESSVKNSYQLSEILACLAFFNIRHDQASAILSKDIVTILEQQSANLDQGQLFKMKLVTIRYLRYAMLYPPKDMAVVAKIIKFILKDCKSTIKVNVEDYNQIYQALLLFRDELPEIPDELIQFLKQIWEQSNKETTITKLQQDVLGVIRSLPVQYSVTSNKGGIEKDIMINEYKGELLPQQLAIEVNGVYHYSRNTEQQLGRDAIKQKIIEKQGYKLLVIPYSDWYILEDKQKPKYMRDLIENTLI